MLTAQLIGQALIAAGNVLLGTHTASTHTTVAQPVVQPVVQPVAVVAQPAVAAGISAAAQSATADSVMALIQPHIGNEAIKAAFGVAMRGLGINALPETQPHQYPALYDAFEKVLSAHGVGASVQQPQPAASII